MRSHGFKLLTTLTITALAGVAACVPIAQSESGKKKGKDRNTLKANLKGKNEVPGPGDPDGKGKALIRLNADAGTVCFRLRWKRIATPTAAHIHVGRKDEEGPVVVPLFAGTPTNRDCVENVAANLIRQIRDNPRGYYVNVHNADFPKGAIRGQLKRTGKHRGQFK